jgi:hypothetical protein
MRIIHLLNVKQGVNIVQKIYISFGKIYEKYFYTAAKMN